MGLLKVLGEYLTEVAKENGLQAQQRDNIAEEYSDYGYFGIEDSDDLKIKLKVLLFGKGGHVQQAWWRV